MGGGRVCAAADPAACAAGAAALLRRRFSAAAPGGNPTGAAAGAARSPRDRRRGASQPAPAAPAGGGAGGAAPVPFYIHPKGLHAHRIPVRPARVVAHPAGDVDAALALGERSGRVRAAAEGGAAWMLTDTARSKPRHGVAAYRALRRHEWRVDDPAAARLFYVPLLAYF
eukprot:gene12002-8508_t